MSYRDDGEAARARADALQHELDEANEARRELAAKLEAANATLAALPQADPEPTPDPPSAPSTQSSTALIGLSCAVIFFVVLAVFGAMMEACSRRL